MGGFGLDAVSLDSSCCDRAAGKSEQHSLDSARSGYTGCGKPHRSDDVSGQSVAGGGYYVDGVGSTTGNSDGDGYDVGGSHLFNVDCAAWNREAHTFGFQWSVLSGVCSIGDILVGPLKPSAPSREKIAEDKDAPSHSGGHQAASSKSVE